MQASSNTIQPQNSLIAVFTDERPKVGTTFEIKNNHNEVINVAEVTAVQPSRVNVAQPRQKYQVTARIIA